MLEKRKPAIEIAGLCLPLKPQKEFYTLVPGYLQIISMGENSLWYPLF
jgi:hypothetical protein